MSAWEYARVGARVDATKEMRLKMTRTPERRVERMVILLGRCPAKCFRLNLLSWRSRGSFLDVTASADLVMHSNAQEVPK
jgi:hypothetical protein